LHDAGDHVLALLRLEAAYRVHQPAARTDTLEASVEQGALQIRPVFDVLRPAAPADLGVARQVAQARAGGVHEDGVEGRAVVDAFEPFAREVGLDHGKGHRRCVQPSPTHELLELVETRPVAIDRDDRAASFHQLRDLKGLRPHSRARIEHTLARLRRQQAHWLLGSDSLHGNQTLVVQWAVEEITSAAQPEHLGLAIDNLDRDASMIPLEALSDRVCVGP